MKFFGGLTLAVILIIFSDVVFALEACERHLTQYRIQTWQTDDGLPLNTVRAIAQTPDGFIWAGTESGLARFDGQKFESVDLTQAGKDVSTWVESLAVTNDGALLIGTGSGGLLAIDELEMKPERVFAWPQKIESLTVTGDGNIWFDPRGGGLMRMADKSRVPQPIETENATVTALAPRSAGGTWVGYSGQGVMWSDGSKLHPVKDFRDLADHHIESILETADGTLWIGTRDGLYHAKNGQLSRQSNGQRYITTMVEDASGAVWAGTSGGGLFRYCNGAVQRLTAEDGLSSDLVRQVMIDANGDIWIATGSGGIGHLSAGPAVPITPKQGLPDNPILPIIQDAEDTMWVGTFGGGIAWIDESDVEVFDESNGLVNNLVFSFARAPDNSIWVGTRGGLTRFVDREPVRTLTKADGLPADGVMSLYHDGALLWIGTVDGLASWDGQEVKHYQPQTGDFRGHIVISLHQDRNDTLWIGTHGDGVYRLTDGVLDRPDLWSDSTGSVILDFHERPDGAIWIATNSGLTRYGPDSIDSVTQDAGLPDPVVSSIIEDEYGLLWLGSNGGIIRTAPDSLNAVASGSVSTLDFQHFTSADGMPTTETNSGFKPSVWRDTEGRIWYPTSEGIAVFDPASIESHRSESRVFLTGLNVEGNAHQLSAPVSVDPRPAFIEFDFSAPEFRYPKHLEYRYRLNGMHNEWYSTTNRSALYHRPGPGKYTFEVQARVRQAPWSPSARLHVNVQRHLLDNPWLWAILALAVIATVAIALMQVARVRARRRAQVEQGQKLEAIGLLAGGIAHDFNNVLTAIMGNVEMIELDSPQDSSIRKDAAAIRSATEKGAALTRQLLTFSRRQSDTTEWLHVASELRALEDFLQRLLTRAVDLNLSIRDEHSEVLMDRIHFQQILLNLVTNARDAMPDGGTVSIELVTVSDDTCRLTVQDEGIGMDKRTRNRIFEPFFSTKQHDRGTGLGLSVTHGIVKSAGGQIEVDSKPGAGTSFHIFLPARRAANE